MAVAEKPQAENQVLMVAQEETAYLADKPAQDTPALLQLAVARAMADKPGCSAEAAAPAMVALELLALELVSTELAQQVLFVQLHHWSKATGPITKTPNA